MGRDQSVLAAGGYIASLLPGAPDGVIDALEKNVVQTDHVTGILEKGNAEELVRSVMSGFKPKILEHCPIEYRCYCSLDRVLAAVASISEEELADMRSKGEPVEVTCQFCDVLYSVTPEEIEAYRKK